MESKEDVYKQLPIHRQDGVRCQAKSGLDMLQLAGWLFLLTTTSIYNFLPREQTTESRELGLKISSLGIAASLALRWPWSNNYLQNQEFKFTHMHRSRSILKHFKSQLISFSPKREPDENRTATECMRWHILFVNFHFTAAKGLHTHIHVHHACSLAPPQTPPI